MNESFLREFFRMPLADKPEKIALRDEFALAAMTQVQFPMSSLNPDSASVQRVANHCYVVADAMLKARAK